MAKSVSEVTFGEEVLAADGVTVVDFWAEWCGPCRAMDPVLEELSGEFAGRINVAKVNVDENASLAGSYGVMSIPAFIFFKDGVEAQRVVGARSASAMRDIFAGVLAA